MQSYSLMTQSEWLKPMPKSTASNSFALFSDLGYVTQLLLITDYHEHGPTAHSDPDDDTPRTTNEAQHLLCQPTDNTRARLLHHEQ